MDVLIWTFHPQCEEIAVVTEYLSSESYRVLLHSQRVMPADLYTQRAIIIHATNGFDMVNGCLQSYLLKPVNQSQIPPVRVLLLSEEIVHACSQSVTFYQYLFWFRECGAVDKVVFMDSRSELWKVELRTVLEAYL